jgi:RNA polymerase sigma factor (sigma-70 family)
MSAAEASSAMPAQDPRAGEAERVARFEALFRANSRPIMAYALRRCRHEEDAADVLAEVMLTAWRRWPDVPPGNQARLWLYGVARRVVANRSRSKRRQTRIADRLRADLAEQLHNGPTDDHPESDAVRAALERLTETDREVLLLSAWEELEPTEIAQILDLAPVTVRSRLHRARKRLRVELEAARSADPSGGDYSRQKGRS